MIFTYSFEFIIQILLYYINLYPIFIYHTFEERYLTFKLVLASLAGVTKKKSLLQMENFREKERVRKKEPTMRKIQKRSEVLFMITAPRRDKTSCLFVAVGNFCFYFYFYGERFSFITTNWYGATKQQR